MKLKQALVIGLTSAILAIPALATESAATSMPTAANAEKQAALNPAKKEASHKKGHKKCLGTKAATEAQDNAKLNELNTMNPSDVAKD